MRTISYNELRDQIEEIIEEISTSGECIRIVVENKMPVILYNEMEFQLLIETNYLLLEKYRKEVKKPSTGQEIIKEVHRRLEEKLDRGDYFNSEIDDTGANAAEKFKKN